MTTAQLIEEIRTVDRKELPALLVAIAGVMAEPVSVGELPAIELNGGGHENLTIEEAAQLLRRSSKWIYRHKARLLFIKKIGPRSFVCSRAGLLRWRDCQRSC